VNGDLTVRGCVSDKPGRVGGGGAASVGIERELEDEEVKLVYVRVNLRKGSGRRAIMVAEVVVIVKVGVVVNRN